MFGIGTGELIVIVIIALVFLGPKRIPDFAKSVGRAIREFNRAKDEIRDGIMKASHPGELEEIKTAFKTDGPPSDKP